MIMSKFKVPPFSPPLFFPDTNASVVNNAIMLEQEEPASLQAAVNEFKTYWNASKLLAALAQNNRMTDPFLQEYLTAGKR